MGCGVAPRGPTGGISSPQYRAAMILNSEPLAGELGLLFLRITAGGGMLWLHGWPKLMHFSERMDRFADPFGLGPAVSLTLIVFAEVVCAALVLLGLWTRAAVIPLLIGMGTVAFVVKGGDPVGEKELALVYLAMYLVLLLTGSGRYSVDRIRFQ